MQYLWIVAVAVAALAFTRRKPAGVVRAPPVAAPTLDTGPPAAADSKPSLLEALVALAPGGKGGNGPAEQAVVNCGVKPKLPANWAELPISHPKRKARRDWLACKKAQQ